MPWAGAIHPICFEGESRRHTLPSACLLCADCVDKVEIFGIRFFRNSEANSILQLKLAAAAPDTITQKNLVKMTVPQLNFRNTPTRSRGFLTILQKRLYQHNLPTRDMWRGLHQRRQSGQCCPSIFKSNWRFRPIPDIHTREGCCIAVPRADIRLFLSSSFTHFPWWFSLDADGAVDMLKQGGFFNLAKMVYSQMAPSEH